jgi:hypothetical protein
MKAKRVVCILVMTLLITTALPAIGTMNEKEKSKLSNSQSFITGDSQGCPLANPAGVVLWDNGMHYHGAISSHWDPTSSNEAIGADDFQFEETTVITDVHWMSLYGDYYDYDFDFNLTFYTDRGDGKAPGDKIFEHVFLNAEVHETFVEEIEKWGSWMFSYWVDLPDPITFNGGEKYWISIQGNGPYFTKTFWMCHAPVVLQEFVWKSPYFGVLDWITSSDNWDISRDFCFQLTGDGEPVIPDLECEGELRWDEVKTGSIVNGTITIMNNGDVGSMLHWKVESVPDWGTNWTLTWTKELDPYAPYSTNYGYVGTTIPEEIIVQVKAPDKKNDNFNGEIILVNNDDPADTCVINVVLNTPRSKTMNNPILQFLDDHPNLFPILQLFIEKLGL